MGDRSNLFFRNQKGGIGVYGHWAGLGMAEAAARVLKSRAFRARIGDANYATRIGVQLVLEALGASSSEETGFGLWTPITGPDDNEYPFIIIDVADGSVFVSASWKAPKPKDRVDKPTAALLRKRMSNSKGEDLH